MDWELMLHLLLGDMQEPALLPFFIAVTLLSVIETRWAPMVGASLLAATSTALHMWRGELHGMQPFELAGIHLIVDAALLFAVAFVGRCWQSATVGGTKEPQDRGPPNG